MKFKIFENSLPVDLAPIVRLIKTEGGVSLVFVDNRGKPTLGGYIVTLTDAGTLRPCVGVTTGAGLQLDRGHIAIDNSF